MEYLFHRQLVKLYSDVLCVLNHRILFPIIYYFVLLYVVSVFDLLLQILELDKLIFLIFVEAVQMSNKSLFYDAVYLHKAIILRLIASIQQPAWTAWAQKE